jgi:hypothetical protein
MDEHEQTLDENNIRDFIDVYLLQIKQEANNGGNKIYTGTYIEMEENLTDHGMPDF